MHQETDYFMSSFTGESPGYSKVYQEDPPIEDIVLKEDVNLIKDIISLLSGLQHPDKICKKWNILLRPTRFKQYEVTGLIDTREGSWQVDYSSLDLIRQLNYSHITNVSVKGTAGNVEISVIVTSLTERALVTECDVIRVRKRTRWFQGILGDRI